MTNREAGKLSRPERRRGMRLPVKKISLGGMALGVVWALACGSNGSPGFQDAQDAGPAPFEGGADAPFAGCATSTIDGKPLDAAMLIVLDRSASMAEGNKYAAAQLAIVSAIDKDPFDTMSLGLLVFPQATDVPGPACLLGGSFPVSCGVSGLPHVAIKACGTEKSNGNGGVRKGIYDELTKSGPYGQTPSYLALQNGIAALKAFPLSGNGKRILLHITDGGATCASLSNRGGYQDSVGCPDWEHPDSIVTLLKQAHDDTSTPIQTFVVGVPGADTHGENSDVAPYSVRLALSAYAYAGSPETVPATCDGKAFTQTNTDPSVPCHFDMTTGTFNAQTLTDAIAQIRGQLLGCIFDLPAPDGGTVDRSKVNVSLSDASGTDNALYRRKDASSACTDGCWDYNADGKVELFGKSCEDLKKGKAGKLKIVVGCETIVK